MLKTWRWWTTTSEQHDGGDPSEQSQQNKHPYKENAVQTQTPKEPTKRELCALKFLKVQFTLHGLTTFASWSGFGVVTDWPQPKYEKQIKLIPSLCKKLLPKNYFYCGPEMAAGGALVFYVWRKDDPRLKSYLKVSVEDYIRGQK
ncbi:MAG: hypothetical protein WC459_02585 [Patescibacteria group bacterium]